MSMIGLDPIDEVGRERTANINALERMLKLVPMQCAGVVPDGYDLALVDLGSVGLIVSRRGDEWTYRVHQKSDVVLSVTPLIAKQAAEKFSEYIPENMREPSILSSAIASRIACVDAKAYESRRTQELTKAFREA